MRFAVTAAVLLAVVATALVTVCQHSETRHLQYRVWQLERRRERLERTRRRLEAAIEAARTPRRLLGAGGAEPTPFAAMAVDPAGERRARPDPVEVAVPAGFDPGDNFEGVDR